MTTSLAKIGAVACSLTIFSTFVYTQATGMKIQIPWNTAAASPPNSAATTSGPDYRAVMSGSKSYGGATTVVQGTLQLQPPTLSQSGAAREVPTTDRPVLISGSKWIALPVTVSPSAPSLPVYSAPPNHAQQQVAPVPNAPSRAVIMYGSKSATLPVTVDVPPAAAPQTAVPTYSQQQGYAQPVVTSKTNAAPNPPGIAPKNAAANYPAFSKQPASVPAPSQQRGRQ